MGFRFFALAIAAFVTACANPDSGRERLYEDARLEMLRGTHVRALERIDHAERLQSDVGTDWGWRTHLLRAEILILSRDLPGALAVLEKLPQQPPLPAFGARRTYLRALAHVFQSAFPEANELLDEARRQATAASADDVLMDVEVLKGQLLLRTRKWKDAEAVLQQVLGQAAARGDAYHQAGALHNLGFGRLLQNRYDEALGFFDRLLALSNLEAYTVYGTGLTNAGFAHARLGQFDRAEELLQKAIQSHEARGASAYLGQALGELGTAHLLQNDARSAMPYLSRALEIATANRAPDAAVWAGNLAKVAIDLGQFEEADRFNREAIRLKTEIKGSTIYNTYYGALIAAGRGQPDQARRLYNDVLAASSTQPGLQWEAHDGLARLALSTGDRRTAARHFAAALDTIQRTRSDLLKTEYRLTFLSRVVRFYQDYVDTLVQMGDTKRALEVADSSRGVVLAERMGGKVATNSGNVASFVATAARTKSVWLSYWLAPERSYVWVVSPGGVQSATLPPGPQIEKLVKEYRTMVERSSIDPLASSGTPGDTLYAAVVKPVARFIPPGSSIRIVADGALHGINFETLPVDGPRRHYWIEDVTVAMAPSLGLLATNAARPPAAGDGSLLLVGDPTPRLSEFPRLGYAPVEMKAVSSHFADRTVRHDGDRASPAEYFAAGPDRFSVIHFTAHAAANHTSPLDSAVILSGPPGADKLYARDVAERSLRAELVTISACRSAGERAYIGEGLVGFSWAFLRAGARQVVAGLWDVDDQSTAGLMDTLYSGIASGLAAPDALRAAKLALMRRGGNVARPYYWGPFELFTVTP
jgi:CHAT domain-containing protein/tetratricopeptide (TPR) repeat protein